MKIVYFIKNNLFMGFILFVITSNYIVFAGTEPIKSKIEPLALRKIMSDMDKNMQLIVTNISHGDWKQVEKSASKIAEHPQPPFTEKIKLLNYVGSDISRFKAYDNQTHDTAKKLSKAAQEKDGFKVILEFSNLQKTCLSCHQYFRKDFIKYFYQ
jgi:cytochrome c556